ncbi:MAG: hypothetical protein RXR82_06865 [Nitrososphaeria archaeon]
MVVSSAERGRVEERERRGSQERREAEGREERHREPEPPTKRETSAAAAAAARPALTIPRFVGREPPRLSASISLAQEPPRVAPAPGPAVVRFAGAIPPRVSVSPRLEGGLPSPPPAPPPIPVRAVVMRAPSLSARAVALAAELPGPPAVPGPSPVRFSPAPTPTLAASEVRLESSLPIVPPRPARAPAMEERAQTQSAAPSQLQGEVPGGGGEEELQEPKDFLEWILRGSAAGSISGRGPYVILYEEYVGREEGRGIPSDTVHLLERILVRRYREIMGGEPRPEIVTRSEVLGGLEGQPWDVNPAHKIYRMKLGDLVKEEAAGGPLDEAQQRKELRKRVGMFLNRFRESYAGDLGFLILHTSSARRGLEDVLVEEIRMVMKGKLIELEAGTLGKLDLRRKYDLLCELAGLAFGIDTRGLEGTNSLSDCIGQASSYWEEAVLDVLKEREGLYHYLTAEWKGESKESDDHYRMKVLVVKHLVESRGDLRELAESRNIKELRERIRTEQPIGAGDVVSDVAVDGEYYEVEELFGEGPFGGFKKVQETVEKYGGIQGRVTVVVEGLAALIHKEELRNLLGHLEDYGFRGRVRVAIPFLTREGGRWRVDLVDLEDYRRRLQDLRRRMEEAARASDR